MLLLPVLCFLFFAFCRSEAYAATVATVMDSSGSPVVLPNRRDRILVTCYGGASHEIALLGGAARIIGQPSMERFPLFLKIFPELDGKPDAGSFNNVNIEFAMTLKPDLVVASVTSANMNEKIKHLGFPVVTVGTGRTNVELLLQEFAMMGEVLGAEERTAELIALWRDRLDMIRWRTARLTEVQRKKVFYCSAGSPMKTEGSVVKTGGNLGWGESFIIAAGGKNVAETMQLDGAVTAEQLMLWNPDVIVTSIQKIGSPGDRMGEIRKLTALTAVQQGAIHSCPIGAFWWDRPSPEAVLGIMWLARILYPEFFTDVNMRSETKEFYRKFYRYMLTDAEYDSFVE